jgi:hypothetical protein
MFSRWTRSARIRLGWLMAALYLACVLIPGIALALGGAAPCFADQVQAVVISAMDDDAAMMMDDSAEMPMHHQAGAENLPAGHHHDGKTAPGPCCAMLCISALPAALPTLPKPSQPVSIALSETDRSLQGKAPPLLYRPPIA